MYNKLSDVSFANYVSCFDFVCLTETFVDHQFDFRRVFIDYTKFHAPAKKVSVYGRNSGGVLLIARNEFAKFASQIRVECDNAEVVNINKCVFGLDKDVVLVAC